MKIKNDNQSQRLFIDNYKPIPKDRNLDLSEPTINLDINPESIPEQYPQSILDEPDLSRYLGVSRENGEWCYSWETFSCFDS